VHRRIVLGIGLATTCALGPPVATAWGANQPANERSAPGSAPIVVRHPDGFDWADAVIGAAAGVGVALAAAGGITLARNR
jgi:hypothetical protein